LGSNRSNKIMFWFQPADAFLQFGDKSLDIADCDNIIFLTGN